MRFNVPRLGMAAGYVHADTGDLNCAPTPGFNCEKRPPFNTPEGMPLIKPTAAIAKADMILYDEFNCPPGGVPHPATHALRNVPDDILGHIHAKPGTPDFIYQAVREIACLTVSGHPAAGTSEPTTNERLILNLCHSILEALKPATQPSNTSCTDAIQAHLNQMAPHQKDRKTAQLLAQALNETKHLTAVPNKQTPTIEQLVIAEHRATELFQRLSMQNIQTDPEERLKQSIAYAKAAAAMYAARIATQAAINPTE
jgi:hypothetical protein